MYDMQMQPIDSINTRSMHPCATSTINQVHPASKSWCQRQPNQFYFAIKIRNTPTIHGDVRVCCLVLLLFSNSPESSCFYPLAISCAIRL